MENIPADAIDMQTAMGRFGHTWTWYKNHVTIYYSGTPRKGYVSESEVQREHDKSEQVTVRKPGED